MRTAPLRKQGEWCKVQGSPRLSMPFWKRQFGSYDADPKSTLERMAYWKCIQLRHTKKLSMVQVSLPGPARLLQALPGSVRRSDDFTGNGQCVRWVSQRETVSMRTLWAHTADTVRFNEKFYGLFPGRTSIQGACSGPSEASPRDVTVVLVRRCQLKKKVNKPMLYCESHNWIKPGKQP